MKLRRACCSNTITDTQANFMITQLITTTHFNVSATVGGLLQELNCHCSLDGGASRLSQLMTHYTLSGNDWEADSTLKLRTHLQVGDIMELLQFVVTTTYLSFRSTIYQQKFGTAMGSPVSPVIANLFMEWLEQQAIATAPLTCQPRPWKRHVDDVMEIVKKGCEQQLTAHLNTFDTTNNNKLTYEEESEGSLPFDLMVRNEDGTVKLDQYLDFSSHHPLHQKLWVIKTLLGRSNNIVTEPEDRRKEEEHITRAHMSVATRSGQ